MAQTVREIMSPVPAVLQTERTLEEARDFLRERKATAAPVVTAAGFPLGVVTQFQLLKCFLKRSQTSPDKNQIGNYLTELEGAVTISEQETVTSAFRALLSAPGRRVFVLGADGKISGFVEAENFYMIFGDSAPPTKKRLKSDGSLAEIALEERLFGGASCTLHALDFRGRILAANRFIHDLLGYESGELVGKTVKDLYAPPEQEDVMKGLLVLRDTGFASPGNSAFIKKDQTLVKVDLATLVIYDGGTPVCTVTSGVVSEAPVMLDVLRKIAAKRKTGL